MLYDRIFIFEVNFQDSLKGAKIFKSAKNICFLTGILVPEGIDKNCHRDEVMCSRYKHYWLLISFLMMIL